MIKLNTIDVTGWTPAIKSMRNPKNSWDRSDSKMEDGVWRIGENDMKLALSLAKGGPVHAKYRRMINVYVDITAPLYWWKEFDTYKIGTVANSCSTMHKIHEKPFTLEDFSCEHLGYYDPEKDMVMQDGTSFVDEEHMESWPMDIMTDIVACLNHNRKNFIETKDKSYWWQLIQLLPSSYNQKRTVMLSYEVLHNIYFSRKDHKLDEWHDFCDWIEALPYNELITQKETGIETYPAVDTSGTIKPLTRAELIPEETVDE